jgi:hypothetical protein
MRIGLQEGIMARAQCLIVREQKILMVKHRENDYEYWCLPGGRIEPDELPSEAALRELSLFSTPMKILFEFNVFQIDPRVREIQCLNKSALKHC